MPVIIRLDGKAFHTFTKGFQKPFDKILIETMQQTAKYLCENITGCKLAYTQSDEISLLVTDYDNEDTQAWFDNNLQKMVSVSASMATMEFNRQLSNNINTFKNNHTCAFPPIDFYSFFDDKYYWDDEINYKTYNSYFKTANTGAMFDARAFVLPEDEVCNYFIWRQQDAIRNSIQMVAQSLFSHSELQYKNCLELKEMLIQEKGVNWDNFDAEKRQGSCCIKVLKQLETVERMKWTIDKDIPLFTESREYITKCLPKI